MFVTQIPRGRATVARQAHNLKIVGSIPTSATRITKTGMICLFLLFSRGWFRLANYVEVAVLVSKVQVVIFVDNIVSIATMSA